MLEVAYIKLVTNLLQLCKRNRAIKYAIIIIDHTLYTVLSKSGNFKKPLNLITIAHTHILRIFIVCSLYQSSEFHQTTISFLSQFKIFFHLFIVDAC